MYCLLDFSDPYDVHAPRLRHAFERPVQVLCAQTLEQVRPVVEAAQAAACSGLWVLGWLCYEAAGAFDAALSTHAPAPGQALAWFAVFEAAQAWPAAWQPQPVRVQWQPQSARAAFDAALAQLEQGIAQGQYYQVNYTAPSQGVLQGRALDLFQALQRVQPGGYGAFFDSGAQQVLSVSPELFFHWQMGCDGVGALLTRPMKGTAARGDTPQADALQAAQLRASTKECAENVMIVDLLRNDLSRVAQPGSVQVPSLFDVQALPTVWQMTSDVQARTRRGTTLWDVLAALFPCGSVTGAPKVAAMQAIGALEPQARGVYCGALGVLRPAGQGAMTATFNVPIRTLQVHAQAVRADVGSGIVWGATCEAEWREWSAKRVFFERASEPFEVLETLALCEGQYRHLPLHLARLQAAAAHFRYPLDMAHVQVHLHRLAQGHAQGLWRVRLLLDAQGTVSAQAAALAPTATPVCLQLAPGPLAQADSEFVRYKTTRRAHYAAFAPQAGTGVFDTLLFNTAGEITETTFGNVAALLDGQWVTPALDAGLLPGIGRAVALQAGRVREGRITLADLPCVQSWAFLNSLRGWLEARLL